MPGKSLGNCAQSRDGVTEHNMKTILLPNDSEFIPFDNPRGVGYWMAIAEFPDESMLNKRMQHDWRLGSCLLDAVREGRLRVRDCQTRFPLKPDAPSVAVLSSLVSVEDFREFVADLGYSVRVEHAAPEPAPAESMQATPIALSGRQGTPPALTDQQKSEIVERFQGKASVASLGREFGVSRRTVDDVLMAAGAKDGTLRDGRKVSRKAKK